LNSSLQSADFGSFFTIWQYHLWLLLDLSDFSIVVLTIIALIVVIILANMSSTFGTICQKMYTFCSLGSFTRTVDKPCRPDHVFKLFWIIVYLSTRL